MRAGRLRTRLLVQQRWTRDDRAAGSRVEYREIGRLWGDVRTSGGREFFAQKQQLPELSHEVEVRYASYVRASLRLVVGEQVFNIVAVVDPTGRRERLLLFCVAQPLPVVETQENVWCIGDEGILIGLEGLVIGGATP